MDSWTREKSGRVVKDLANIVDTLKDNPIFADVSVHLSPAIYNATKLWAASQGAEWDPRDRDRIMVRGTEGYEELQVFYGIKNETKISYENKVYREAITKIREYIKGQRSPNRTLIHDVLSPLDFRIRWVDEIESLTMKVTMGEKEWDEYTEEVEPILDSWDDEIKKSEVEIESRMSRN